MGIPIDSWASRNFSSQQEVLRVPFLFLQQVELV